ncbi:hypothetical protein [Acrocarpospora catenulata]|uniref:hypothetical protein n=1 Tax=Acrocarpospora catenulata TaxID=2836182 RepID=UPI001BD98ED7|nr:hypothetical protein [Acrocarpospora catenulata]
MALWLATLGVPFVVGVRFARADPTGNEVASAVLGLLMALVPHLIVGLLVAERVSLSRRDIFRGHSWARRAAFLPYRDWPPLPSEVDRLERIVVEGDKRRVFRFREEGGESRVE